MACTRHHSWNYHAYIISLTDFEYSVEIPTISTDHDNPVTLYISKVGGGTIGESYTGQWYWCITNGEDSRHGDELSSGTPKTHEEMSRVLAGFLAENYPEESDMSNRFSLYATSLRIG
jgi:hypothetical protein